jgi:hypothetical protein
MQAVWIVVFTISQIGLLVSQVLVVRMLGRWMKEYQELRREQLNIIEILSRPENLSAYPHRP